MQVKRCKVCGGTVNILGNGYIRCNYCGQIYDMSGGILGQEQIYNEALDKSQQGTIEGSEQARKLFESISGYKDSNSRALESYTNVENIKIAMEEKRLEEERQWQIALEEDKKRAIRNKKIKQIIIMIAGIIATITCIIVINISKHEKVIKTEYNNAIELFDNEQYGEAKEIFVSLNGYKDSINYIEQINTKLQEQDQQYNEALSDMELEDYQSAIVIFSQIQEYLDTNIYLQECVEHLLSQANELTSNEQYDEAIELLEDLPENINQYENIKETLANISELKQKKNYDIAVKLYDSQEFVEAQSKFLEMPDYEESRKYIDLIGDILYEDAKNLFNNMKYVECVDTLKYIDENKEWSNYKSAKTLQENAIESYKTEIENAALEILKNGSYKEFSDYLIENVCDIYSSDEASKLIKQWKPQNVSSLDVFNKEDDAGIYCREFQYESGVVDNVGKTHNNVLLGGGYTEVYHINKEYDKLSGCAFILQKAATTKKKLVLQIRDENDNVLYYLEMTGGDIPVEFSVDISEVVDLKIYFNGFNGSWGAENAFYGGISDLVVFSVPD